MAGDDIVSLNDVILLCGFLTHNKPRILNLPYVFMYLLALLSQTFLGSRSPIRLEQVIRLKENKVHPNDWAKVCKDERQTDIVSGLRHCLAQLEA